MEETQINQAHSFFSVQQSQQFMFTKSHCFFSRNSIAIVLVVAAFVVTLVLVLLTKLMFCSRLVHITRHLSVIVSVWLSILSNEIVSNREIWIWYTSRTNFVLISFIYFICCFETGKFDRWTHVISVCGFSVNLSRSKNFQKPPLIGNLFKSWRGWKTWAS